MEARVTGASGLRRIARALRDAERADLKRELDRGLRAAVKPIAKDVHAGLPSYIPSGFLPVLDRALRVVPQLRSRAGRLTVRATAAGKQEKRDLARMNRGVLKHPLWGNRGHWIEQPIRPGFFDEPAKRMKDYAAQAANDALARVAEQIRRS